LVLRIIICAKSPALRVAAKRYAPLFEDQIPFTNFLQTNIKQNNLDSQNLEKILELIILFGMFWLILFKS